MRLTILRPTDLRRAAIFLALCIGACSGGNETAGIDRGGVRSPVAASGPITAFGSIFVNGVRFDIASAQIDVNGATATEQDLAIGQIVQVEGELFGDGFEGEASTVIFESNVTGLVGSVDPASGVVVVLGQTVDASSAVIELPGRAAALQSLVPGDRVEVSGHVDAAGTIRATRIALDEASELRVRGAVASLDPGSLRLTVNDLVIDFASAGMIEGFPDGAPSVGDVIVAAGAELDADGALVASRLRLFEAVAGEPGDEAEVEDLITRFASVEDFDVGGRAVRTTADTDYEGGGPGDLGLDVKVQVEGRFDAAGVIVAEKIEIKDGGRVQSED